MTLSQTFADLMMTLGQSDVAIEASDAMLTVGAFCIVQAFATHSAGCAVGRRKSSSIKFAAKRVQITSTVYK